MFYRIKIVCLKEKIVKVLKRNNKKVLNAIFKVPIILVRKKTLMKTKPKRLIQGDCVSHLVWDKFQKKSSNCKFTCDGFAIRGKKKHPKPSD